MYGKPRTATVTCVVDGWLWCLERKAFRGILVDRMTHDNTVKVLRKVGLLATQRRHNGIHVRWFIDRVMWSIRVVTPLNSFKFKAI